MISDLKTERAHQAKNPTLDAIELRNAVIFLQKTCNEHSLHLLEVKRQVYNLTELVKTLNSSVAHV